MKKGLAILKDELLNIHLAILQQLQNVTQHEKIGLMRTKYTPSHYSTYLIFWVTYASSVNCIKLLIIVCCINHTSFIGKM